MSPGLRSRWTAGVPQESDEAGHDGHQHEQRVLVIAPVARRRLRDREDPAEIPGDERQDEDTENVEPAMYRGLRAADREDEGADQSRSQEAFQRSSWRRVNDQAPMRGLERAGPESSGVSPSPRRVSASHASAPTTSVSTPVCKRRMDDRREFGL